jgi:GT2 family glycosyltransferase
MTFATAIQGEETDMDISVVIVNWNTCDILRDCLKTIYEQTRHVAFEVIVVDNASSDGSPEMVRVEFPQVVLLANPTNAGYATANNQGIRIAQGRFVLVLNSDTLILDRALDKILAFVEAHPEVGVLGCRVRNRDGTLQPTCFMFPSVLNMFLFATCLNQLFARSRFFGRERMTWWKRDDVRAVDVVTGCFMLVRQEAIRQVGLMDEDFFMYGEETDWCYRFRQAGWKVMFSPCAEIIHLGGASSARVANEMTLQLKAGVLQFMHKHRSRPAYVAACGLMGLFLAARIPYWLIQTVLARGQRRLAWSRVVVYARGLLRVCRGWRGLRASMPAS